jgi:digeranylgeranylglycerophospholipid reductase
VAKKYDVVIVGAGPGGAMAAKTAGENGLTVAILERKRNPADIRRGCAMMFSVESDYCFGERMYYCDKSGKMVFPVNGFSVDYGGPKRNFYAWHFYAPDGNTRFELGGYEESVREGDKGRLSFVYDQGVLIDGLMKEAAKNGVDVFTGVNVTGVEKRGEGVKVTGSGRSFEATFAIAADGTSSRTAQVMGFNEGRTFYGYSSGLTYYATGLNVPQPEAVISGTCFKPDAQFPTLFWVIPSPYSEDEHWVSLRSREDFEYVTEESTFSGWFPHVKVTRLRSFVTSIWSPVCEPFKDNVILVGDAAWFGEAEITGSMMCGWKAAHAVAVALRDDKPNRDGVSGYIDWWKKSYPEFDDYRNFVLFMPFRLTFSEEELNYLYGIIEGPLRATLSVYRVVRLVRSALEPIIPQIQKEMPSIVEKLKMMEIERADEILSALKGHLKKAEH